jgi:hypothetical protein
METLQASPEWKVLLDPFQSLFTKPGYRLFCAFVVAFAHVDRRLWVTQVVLSSGLDRHSTCFHKFLSRAVWGEKAVCKKMFALCLPYCLVNGRLFSEIDDTVCKKSGRKFESLGLHHDPMNHDHPRQLSRGHCFVCLALIGQPVLNHFVGLFIGCALYVQKSVRLAQQQAAEGTKKSSPAFCTKLELAARLMAELEPPPGVVFIAVADGAYARKTFVQGVNRAGHHVLARLRSDTVFYDLPPKPKRGPDGKYPRGRRRKYGRKHKASVWAAALGTWHTVILTLYGKEETLHVKTRVVLQRALGARIRVVAVAWGERPLVFLFCTDPTLTKEALVSAYCARFSIETGFRDAKESFGLETYQVRKEASIVRLVHLCFWAQTLLRLRYWNQKPQPIYGRWRKRLDYLTLSQQKRLSQQECRISAGLSANVPTAENPARETLVV